MKMAKMSSAVQSASMKRPRVTETPSANVVRTAKGPGSRPDTTAAAAIAPTICARMSKNAFTQPIAPTRARATDTYTGVSGTGKANKRGTHGWVEEPSTDAKEDPDIDKQ